MHSIANKARDLFGIDLRGLAFFRGSMAVLIICDLVNRSKHLIEFHTNWGAFPNDVAIGEWYGNQSWIWSLHYLGGNAFWQAALFVLTFIIALMLFFGWRTRTVAILSWVLLVSLQNRNPLVLQGGDVLWRVMLFWALFLPLGKVWSLDQGRSREQTPTHQHFLSVASLAFIVQLLLMYTTSAIYKTGDAWRTEGTAIYYALSLDQFSTRFGEWLTHKHALTVPMTTFVFYLEKFGALLFFVPVFTWVFRTIGVLLLVGFHAGLILTMHLGLFAWIAIACLLALLPRQVWDGFEQLCQRLFPPRLSLYYSALDKRAEMCAYGLRSFFLHASSPIIRRYEPHPTAAWGVITPKGKVLPRYRAIPVLLRHSFLLLPLTFGLLLWGFAWIFYGKVLDAPRILQNFSVILRHDEWYRLIWQHNEWLELLLTSPLFYLLTLLILSPLLTRLANRLIPYHPLPQSALTPAPAPPVRSRYTLLRTLCVQGIAAFLLVYVLFWNMMELPTGHPLKHDMPYAPHSYRIANILRLDQKWNMFSPYPLKEDGWYIIAGQFRNGRERDLFTRQGFPVREEKPDVSTTYRTQRQRKYMMNLWAKKYEKYRLYYGKALCRRWNFVNGKLRADEENLLDTFQINFMKELTPPPNDEQAITPSVTKVTLWSHNCF